jgi:HEAT repeat protein
VLLKSLVASGRARREAAMRSLLRLLSQLDGAAADRLVERVRTVCGGAPTVVRGAVDRLAAADLSTRLVLVQFLGLLRAPAAAVPVLLAGRDEALAEVAEAALASMGDVAEEAIDAAFAELDADARRAACAVFGRTRGRSGASRLVALLDDRDPTLRASAARAVGERQLVEALPVLVGRLERLGIDEDLEELEEERLAVTQALVALAGAPEGEGSDPRVAARVIEMLTSMLSGAAESVRLAVATVLGCIGRHEDVDVVELLLKDASDRVRRAAVEALAHLEPGLAVEPLRLALADESPAVRISAARALGASRSDAVFEDLSRLAADEDARVRATAVGAIVRRFAEHDEPDRRAAALGLLHRACEDEAPVALAAIEALREIGGASAAYVLPLLRRGEPELVHEAVRCVGSHGGTRELEELIPLVSHPDWSVRAEAIQVLAERRVKKSVPAILRRLEVEQDEFVRGQTLRALEGLET